jgi:hypothetical protein
MAGTRQARRAVTLVGERGHELAVHDKADEFRRQTHDHF